MSSNSSSVNFMYGTSFGRFLLKVTMKLHLDRIAIWYLRSVFSKRMAARFIKKHNIDVSHWDNETFQTYRDFFVRKRNSNEFDPETNHLISPCDGLLSAFSIDENSIFHIKGSHYQVKDFLQDDSLKEKYLGGTCLVLRLCVTDYHHYCYIDDGYQGDNHQIPGVLHSVQPIACETYPVFVLNKRCWCLLETDHFGPVVQCEIGALVVGGIENEIENARFTKGSEKGHFELAGSTIVLLFEADRINLNPELLEALASNEEVRVSLGQWIGTAQEHSADK